MARKEVLPQFAAPAWEPERSAYLVLWHGTTDTARKAIEKKSDLTRCAVSSDFGRGFYLTTLERQAKLWAWEQFAKWKEQHPADAIARPLVMRFRVRRFAAGKNPRRPAERGLDSLSSLHFVRGGFENEEFWSLVQHCRSSRPLDAGTGRKAVVRDHRRGPRRRGWYDVVSGPVAAFWDQRVAMQDSDQFSFHTPAAVAILQDLIALAGEADRQKGENGPPYSWFPVT